MLDSGLLLDAVHEEFARFWGRLPARATGKLPRLAGAGHTARRGPKAAVFATSTATTPSSRRLPRHGASLGRFAHNNEAMPGDARCHRCRGRGPVQHGRRRAAALRPGRPQEKTRLHPLLRRGALPLHRQDGRGCFAHAADAGTGLPQDLDIRTGTLSKAVGGIGGYIAGKSVFVSISPCTRRSQSTAALVQTLWVVRQPLMARRNLSRLSATPPFAAWSSAAWACTSTAAPTRPSSRSGPADPPCRPGSRASSGAAACSRHPSPRRALLGESRAGEPVGRLSPEDVDRLVCAIVEAARHGCRAVRRQSPHASRGGHGGQQDGRAAGRNAAGRARSAFDAISRLILQTSREQTPHCRPPALTAAGHAARHMYRRPRAARAGSRARTRRT